MALSRLLYTTLASPALSLASGFQLPVEKTGYSCRDVWLARGRFSVFLNVLGYLARGRLADGPDAAGILTFFFGAS